MPVLSPENLQSALSEMHGWAIEDGQIAKTFEFDTYNAGMEFAVRVGKLAEARNHHPDILIMWRRVRISLSTHDEGGITERDIGMGADIDGLTAI
jgi:4a-hydroxytetrahydrobiopterin dehydratase